MIERLNTPAIDEIASQGAYARAYTGGEIGNYSQTPTISAIGYTNLFSWANRLSGGMKRCLGIVQAVVGKLMDVRA